MGPSQDKISNRMLTALERDDFGLLAPYLEMVDLRRQSGLPCLGKSSNMSIFSKAASRLS